MKLNQHSDFSYILRLWRVEGEDVQERRPGKFTWRASLDDPHTRERIGFADIEAMFDYLRKETRQADLEVLVKKNLKESGKEVCDQEK